MPSKVDRDIPPPSELPSSSICILKRRHISVFPPRLPPTFRPSGASQHEGPSFYNVQTEGEGGVVYAQKQT